ncbi:U32 family peptidase [Ferruginibacter lapsinanis]|uniref:peptidase U32 family protein n=1 Tax=Ferruginibacter lapsinanis TaxID=563172 RepID=UPI001E4AD034|nr:peptidase U32 family protein [Ferruginibacter lapsinanis]UEG51280.1 U32 family peptidase [Ferruginibacter lapsinanis]
MKNNSTPEILAPVGSFESLQAAINAGADAIYFGVEQLNMRTKSSDPITIADIQTIAEKCKAHHIKAYITLNTVMYQHDLQLLRTILTEVKAAGIDAAIAADFAVIEMCRQMQIPLHISTQANVSNIEAVKFFAPLSDVVVLARELTLKQVSDITAEITRKDIRGISGKPLQIEIFVHGALCMAVSGKCFMSLHTQNSSANRGACTQNCRRPYKVTDLETGIELEIDNEYIMSPKDLCTIDILDQVINAGVTVLKIEGRSKGPDYVYTTTKCYREAAEAVINGTYTQEKIEGWKTELTKVYNRGFWEGYYLGRKLGEWTESPGSAATEKKIYLGKGSNYYPKKQVGEFTIESGSLKKGDTIMVTGPACGMVKETREQLYVNGEIAEEAGRGDKITFPFATKVTAKDKLYKIVL